MHGVCCSFSLLCGQATYHFYSIVDICRRGYAKEKRKDHCSDTNDERTLHVAFQEHGINFQA